MAYQEPLTVVAEVDPSLISTLERVLEHMQHDPGRNDVLPFAQVPGCHFGRLVYLPRDKDLKGAQVPPQLLLITDCDGPAHDHVEKLVDASGDGIDRVFGCCEGYPGLPAARADRIKFLRRHMQRVPANYVHRPGRTVEQIHAEAKLREAIETFLDDERFGSLSAIDVHERIVAFVRAHPDLSWALDAPPRIPLRRRARDALHLAALPAGALALAPVLVPAVVVLLALVRMQEERDPSPHIRPTPEHERALSALEDFAAHNGFTASGFVKPGLVRQAVIRLVLPLIGYGTRHLFTRGSLAGVKSIHFARWIPLDGGRRVLFASNYDGSLASYNNDFIDLVSWGLNLVFSNGYEYPKTRWLVFGGATREQEFKDHLRRRQSPTGVWYSAYPDLTAVNIDRNAQLRAGLRSRMKEREARQWLRLF